MRATLFQGKPFVAVLQDFQACGPFQACVTPSLRAEIPVGGEEASLSLVLQYQEPGTILVREVATSSRLFGDNLLRWIRALWFLEALPAIDVALFHHLYSGSRQWLDGNVMLPVPSAHRLREAVGDDQYQAILRRPFPPSALDLLIQFAERGWLNLGDRHLRWELSDEIAAGTLAWNKDLDRIGVKHPTYWRIFRAASREALAAYQPYLAAYAPFAELVLPAPWLEEHLISCLERGIPQAYGPEVACLLAFLQDALGQDAPCQQLITQNRRIEEHIEWLLRSFVQEPITGQPLKEAWQYQKLMQELLPRWKQLPVTHPLVDETGALL